MTRSGVNNRVKILRFPDVSVRNSVPVFRVLLLAWRNQKLINLCSPKPPVSTCKVCKTSQIRTAVCPRALCWNTCRILGSLYERVEFSRYRPGVAQRVGRGIALLFHDRGNIRGWVVSSTPRPLFTPGKTRYPFYRKLGGPQGRFGRAENLFLTGIRSRTVQPVVSHYTDWATRPTCFLYINPLKTKRIPLYLKPQSVPRCKHFPPRLYKTNQLILCKTKVAVCSEIRTEHINPMWAPCRIFWIWNLAVRKEFLWHRKVNDT